jgi:hypothetical protein
VDCQRSEHPGDVMSPSNAQIGRGLDTKTGLISKNALVFTDFQWGTFHLDEDWFSVTCQRRFSGER